MYNEYLYIITFCIIFALDFKQEVTFEMRVDI